MSYKEIGGSNSDPQIVHQTLKALQCSAAIRRKLRYLIWSKLESASDQSAFAESFDPINDGD
jgi:hypothetical protein